MKRYVRVNGIPIFEPKQQCPYCGSFVCNKRVAICKCCNSPQCHGNALGNGQCGICLVGLLPDWSGSNGKCTYKACGKEAVARGRGRKYVCSDHAAHQGIGKPNFTGWKIIE